MDPKNKQFVAYGTIFNSLKGKVVLEGEKQKFNTNFMKKFLYLLERAEGTLLLTFVDVQRFEENDAKRCALNIIKKVETRAESVLH